MNPDSIEEAKDLFSAHAKAAKRHVKVSVVIAAPAPFIAALASKGTLDVCVQDIGHLERGALTGSMSAAQAKSAGARYVLVGHSERRLQGDTDELVAKKSLLALENGLHLILCVGEKERDLNAQYLRAIRDQLIAVLSKLDKKSIASVTIAYEPVWAIGASFESAPKPADVHEMSIYVRKVAAEIVGKKDGLRIPVLYGGAVSADNSESFLRDGGIDGLLVGRQSLDVAAFKKIIDHASQA